VDATRRLDARCGLVQPAPRGRVALQLRADAGGIALCHTVSGNEAQALAAISLIAAGLELIREARAPLLPVLRAAAERAVRDPLCRCSSGW
jgi:hypothetical protein